MASCLLDCHSSFDALDIFLDGGGDIGLCNETGTGILPFEATRPDGFAGSIDTAPQKRVSDRWAIMCKVE